MRLVTLASLAGWTCATVLSSPTSNTDNTLSPLELPTVSSNVHVRPLRNANHVFNAVRGAMRQWDSSWNHNGMSFFRATVPKDIQFYHGRGTEESVTGMEWLAFEPEHALMFARGRPKHPPGEGPYGPPDMKHRRGREERRPRHDWQSKDGAESRSGFERKHGQDDGNFLQKWFRGTNDYKINDDGARKPCHRDHKEAPHFNYNDQHERSHPPPFEHNPDLRDGQHVLTPPPDMPDFNQTGYLHFYRTKHELNLLLIDGMSAGKTSVGTMDAQDYILRGMNTTQSPDRGRAFGDYDRAAALCNMTRDDWHNKIDGFIRMEGGFEIILCRFEDHLTFERAQEVKNENRRGGMGGFRIYEAISDRFHGIGGGRVEVDYESMISAFSYKGINSLFVNSSAIDGEQLPRLANQSEVVLGQVRDDITNMMLSSKPRSAVDWQAVADMFVQRYAAPLQYLVSAHLSSKTVKQELQSLLRPFITDHTANAEVASTRCVKQFVLGDGWKASTAGQAVRQVGYQVCSTLVSTLFDLQDDNDKDTGSRLRELVRWLDWPVWRECPTGCAYNERCVLPIWPLVNGVEFRKQPQCKNATAFGSVGGGRPPGHSEDSYWWN